MNQAVRIAIAVGALAISVGGAWSQAIQPDASRGRMLFARCSGCHALDPAKRSLAPPLKGVVGRSAGAVPPASDTLKRTGLRWSAARLDAFLADPQAVAPGSTMTVKTPGARDRADLIAYLAAQR